MIILISFFLGAGASNPFDYPTTREFKEIIANGLDDKFEVQGNLPELEKLAISILKHRSYLDIEYVLEFMKRLLEMTKKQEYKVLTDFFGSYGFQGEIPNLYRGGNTQGAGLDRYFLHIESLMSFIVDNLYATYSSKPQNIEKSQRIYSSLFSITNQETIEIFTTNYDSLIEDYCRKANYNLIDGFEYDQNSGLKIWKPLLFDEKTTRNGRTIILYKLHGSLNWKRHKDSGIVKLEGTEKIMTDDWHYTDDLLVKPTLFPKEEEGEEPFRTLIDKFGKKLMESDVCIVIGFSLRDRRITQILHDYLTRGKKLILVSPNARRHFQESLGKISGEYDRNNCNFLEERITYDNTENLVAKFKHHL